MTSGKNKRRYAVERIEADGSQVQVGREYLTVADAYKFARSLATKHPDQTFAVCQNEYALDPSYDWMHVGSDMIEVIA